MTVRRLVCLLSVAMVLAILSPAQAKTPLLFSCDAGVTLTFDSDWSGLTWVWDITDGNGSCRTGPLGEEYSVTISLAGGSVLPSGSIYGQTFGFDVRLHLTGRTTGATRSYRLYWEGRRINCTIGRFVALSKGVAPVGTGNLKYCGPIPSEFPNNPSAPESHPALVTWNFVGA